MHLNVMKLKGVELAKYALKQLSTIPEDEFITTHFTNEKSKCCAIGHLVRLSSKDPKNYSVLNCSDAYIDYAACEWHSLRNLRINHDSIVTVNNNTFIDTKFKQKSIKERVLAFLNEYIKLNS